MRRPRNGMVAALVATRDLGLIGRMREASRSGTVHAEENEPTLSAQFRLDDVDGGLRAAFQTAKAGLPPSAIHILLTPPPEHLLLLLFRMKRAPAILQGWMRAASPETIVEPHGALHQPTLLV